MVAEPRLGEQSLPVHAVLPNPPLTSYHCFVPDAGHRTALAHAPAGRNFPWIALGRGLTLPVVRTTASDHNQGETWFHSRNNKPGEASTRCSSRPAGTCATPPRPTSTPRAAWRFASFPSARLRLRRLPALRRRQGRRRDRGEEGGRDADRRRDPVRQVRARPARRPAAWRRPLPFFYESTGVETHFTNGLDPEPRARNVFAFHRPETLAEWLRSPAASRRC